jgi:hypothetical protein
LCQCSARAVAWAVRGGSRGGAQADQDCGSSRRRDDGVRPATAAGEHLQDLMANAANTRSMQREDDMDVIVNVNVGVGRNGNDEGSKGVIIQRS